MSLINKILLEVHCDNLLRLIEAFIFNKVKSSNLNAIAYDPSKRKMRIRFKGGGVYEYDNIPPLVYNKIMRAKSKGKYFWKNIRNSGYDYKKITI